MHPSRFVRRAVLGTALSLLATACTPDMKKSVDDGGGSGVGASSRNTSFNVQKVKPNASLDGISDTLTWKIPTSFQLGVQVCLQDRASNKEVRNQEFTVVVPETRRTYNVTTTNQGCFTYAEEKIPFNLYAAKSGWLTLNREVVGRGVNQGKQRFQVLVNPWKLVNGKRDDLDAAIWPQDGDRGVLPTADQIFPAEQGNLALVGESSSQRQVADAPRLLITDVDLMALPKAEGSNFVTYTFQIAMKPRIKALNSIGIPTYESAYDGDFNIWLHVVQNDMGPQLAQNALLLHGEPYAVGHVVDGVLRAEIQVRQPREANQGNMQLALKVSPRAISVMGAIQPFQGVFNFGQGTVIKDRKAQIAPMCLVTPDDCNFEKMVEQARRALPDLESAGYVQNKQRYIFNNLRLRFLMVESGETATQRTVAYTASTCIIDHDTGAPLRNTPMIIRYLKQGENQSKDPAQDQHEEVEPDVIEKKTDQSGCLNWDGKAFHKYYQPERYFERMISIEKPSGFKQEFKFYINPWDTNVNFGFDAREFGAAKIADMRSRPKIPSRFFLGDFSYHTVRFLYNIDNFMELEVKKWVLMELVPQVLRYSGIKDARKMTEHLRDGIYLMKVAIQKNYLDPRNNTGWLLKENKFLQAEKKTFGTEELAVDQYVTTNMAIVRVVDGMIIYPIELTMRDLRLMRVRANFIVQLQTVDERLIQAYHKFKEHAINAEDLSQKLEAFKRDHANSTEPLPDPAKGELSPALEQTAQSRASLAANREEKYDAGVNDLKTRVEGVHRIVSQSLNWLKKKLEDPNSTDLSYYLNSPDEDIGLRQRVLKDNFITNDFNLNEDLLGDLKKVLKTNDFSEVELPKKQNVDLDIFVEPDSGLKKRSFVGPVIFLSNAYKDSVRATDNLDEAGCTNPDKPADAADNAEAELATRGIEVEKAIEADSKLTGKRQNNAYTYSEYFGALNHLCYKNVDDLIESEKVYKKLKADQQAASSLKGNFARAFGLDFVSLEDEPLKKVRADCRGDVPSCLVDDDQTPLKTSAIGPLVNAHGFLARYENTMNLENVAKMLRGIPFYSGKTNWAPSEYEELFFGDSADSRVGLCTLLANKFTKELDQAGLSHVSDFNVRRKTLEACLANGGLVHEMKDHVKKTDKYMLMGGLNLNVNVGTSFSTSWSGSWSAGIELSDFIGVLGGLPAGLSKLAGGTGNVAARTTGGLTVMNSAIKPFSMKYGTSMSSSEGTSVSESTYLVSQVAKFDVDLLAYERCAVVRLSDSAIHDLGWSLGDNWLGRQGSWKSVNFDDAGVQQLARHGLLVCEGEKRAQSNPKKTVEEMYFYFTQHFTEGDMLDQAELYNHPWLLALRGMRDFKAFAAKVRMQDNVGFIDFIKGIANLSDARPSAWALDHMKTQFANTLPSFPGFYTKPDEDISAFLLQQARDNALNRDPNREVHRPKLGGDADQGARPANAGRGSAR